MKTNYNLLKKNMKDIHLIREKLRGNSENMI